MSITLDQNRIRQILEGKIAMGGKSGGAKTGIQYLDFVKEWHAAHPKKTWIQSTKEAKKDYHKMMGQKRTKVVRKKKAGVLIGGRMRKKRGGATYLDFVKEWHKAHPKKTWIQATKEAKVDYHKMMKKKGGVNKKVVKRKRAGVYAAGRPKRAGVYAGVYAGGKSKKKGGYLPNVPDYLYSKGISEDDYLSKDIMRILENKAQHGGALLKNKHINKYIDEHVKRDIGVDKRNQLAKILEKSLKHAIQSKFKPALLNKNKVKAAPLHRRYDQHVDSRHIKDILRKKL